MSPRSPWGARALAVATLGLSALGASCSRSTTEPPTQAPTPSSAGSEADAGSDFAPIDLPPGDGPVATVNGAPLSREAFNREYVQTLDRYRRARHDVKPALRERLKDNIVRRLVDQEIIAQRAKSLGIQLDPAEMERLWAEHKKRYGSEEAFTAFLERAGTSAEDVRANFDANHLREQVFAKVGAEVTVSADEVKSFFEENRERFDEPEMVRASHILIRIPSGAGKEQVAELRKKADDIRAQASKPGADFEALAREHGEDPTKDRGGDLGFFPKGRMVKVFEDAAWGLKKDKVSKVVETEFGLHVIKKTDHRPASKKKLDEVAEGIEKSLLVRKRNQAIQEALQTWKDEAKVEIFVKGDPAIIEAGIDPPATPPAAPLPVGGAKLDIPAPSSPQGPAPTQPR